jgi:CRISPR system Cascade subunit CasD
MSAFLWLRFDAPLLSFGAPMVDNYGAIQEHPSLSQVCGLLANALGYDHRDFDRTEALQARLRFATRCDVIGKSLRDFQTVDLGQEHLVDTGWTTRGAPQQRGGASGYGTHIRYRDYWADSVYTLALTLSPSEETPSLGELEQALREPARPLFLGRKPCLPSSPILLGRCDAPSLLAALASAPLLTRKRRRSSYAETSRDESETKTLRAWWPADENAPGLRVMEVTDRRDWRNQLHVGRRLLRFGLITPTEAPHA